MNGFIIVISADVQDDRIEAKVKAWGLHEESFLIKRQILRGTPARSDVWQKMDDLIEEEFYHASGLILKPRSVVIDIGGHYTNQTYAWIDRARRRGRNVFGIQGRANTSRVHLIMDKISHNNKYRVPVILAGVDTAKELIRQRLVDYDQTSAQLHFCDDVGSDAPDALVEYFKGLVAEEQVSILNRQTGRVRYEWRIRKGYKRNEPGDLENYNLAGLHVMQLNMKLEHQKFLAKVASHKENPGDMPAPTERKRTSRRNGGGYNPKSW
jgi:phage terminase large subunit GpA-like protein